MYQKEIIYLGLFYNGVKEKNAGYLKVSKNEEKFRLELQVKNLPGAINGSFPIRLQSETGWQEADVFVIKEGNGKWYGNAAEQISRVEIIVSDAKKIRGESRLAAANRDEKEEVKSSEEMPQIFGKRGTMERKEIQGSARQEEPAERKDGQRPVSRKEPELAERKSGRSFVRREEAEEQKGGQSFVRREEPAERKGGQGFVRREEPAEREGGQSFVRREEPAEREGGQSFMRREESAERKGGQSFGRREVESAERSDWMQKDALSTRIRGSFPAKSMMKAEQAPVREEYTPLYENKWEQLLTTYEQIHPYGDNRVYVKLEPKDFIVLRENYQHLVNNSFLLHGFYNYRYLILGKEKDFYLGVPGVFYEREKMVALMFGFEAFECEGGEAEEGKFGYYLRKVEL